MARKDRSDTWSSAESRSRSSTELAIDRRQFQGMRAAAIIAGFLVALALVMWGVGLIAALDADCGTSPAGVEGKSGDASGLDTSLSVWPPGEDCPRGAPEDIAQPLPWINAAVLVPAGLAVFLLFLGAISSIAYRFRKPMDPRSR